MTRVKLTDVSVEAAKAAPKGKRYWLWDDVRRGLALRVTDTGAKSWVVQRRPKGVPKPVRITLGSYPATTLKRARELAWPHLKDMEEGVDPQAKARVAVEAVAAAAAAERRRTEGMLERALDEYEAAAVSGMRTARNVKNMFKNHVRERWADRHMHDLRRLDVLRLRDDVAKGSGKVMADRLLEALNAFFKWQSNRDEEFRSPMPPEWRLVTRKELMRQRALSDAEIRALWVAANEVVPAMYGTLVRLLLLTGQRLGDWQKARWDEIGDKALVIPAARYKGDRDHAVPLTDEARALLAGLPRAGAYVFQVRRGPFVNLSKAKARLDEQVQAALHEAEPEAQFVSFRIHDLRRTARSLLSRAGVERSIAERLIGHSVGDHNERTYDTYGYWREREEAARALSGIVGRIVAGIEAEVVEIGVARRGADRMSA